MTPNALRRGGALLLMVVAVWAGFRLSTHSTGTRGVGPPPPPVRVAAGEASAPTAMDEAEPALPQPRIPDHLPDFALRNAAGISTSIATWQGQSLIVNFWATWCAPCRREIPLLKALRSEWATRDVEVVGIAVDYRDKVVRYAADAKIPYPLLIGEQEALDVAAAFGVASPVFPFTVFTDRRGEVVALYLGELHKPQANLILGVVQDLNHDRMLLPEARRTIAEGLHALAQPPAG